MSERPRTKMERLELHAETIRDLTEPEAENVRGGGAALRTLSNVSCNAAGRCAGGTSPLHTCDPTTPLYLK